jgi:MFS family permease
MSVKLAGKLFGQNRFLPLFVLFQAGTFNDNALKQALIGLVTYGGVVLFSDSIPRESVVPLAALMFTLPFLIVTAIAGQIADKIDRGLILKRIKRFEVGLMCLAALGFFLESPAVLALTLIGMGAQSAFFSPTKNSVLPQWLADDELITGNGLLSGFQFFFILLGQSIGLLLVLKQFPADGFLTGPRVVALILLVLAAVGWFAAERVPSAPAPKPDLRINYNPITATINVLAQALKDMAVFRPLLGIAWFYGLSTIFITAFPTYVADVLRYDQNTLTAILVISTLGILTGSLFCIVLARGKEAVGLVAFGITGVALFTLDLFLNSEQSTREGLGTVQEFFADPKGRRFLFDVTAASFCNGLYVVPLQAMAQRRANPERRARLMSAGSVLLNLSVNGMTFMLIGLGYLSLPPRFPFSIIIVISLIVAVYAFYRWAQLRKRGLT